MKSAKEWLKEEGFKDIVNLKNSGYDYPISVIMERYANYKSREFQALILGFRGKVKSEWMEMPYRYNEDFLKEYDEYFNIKEVRNGTI